MKNIILLVIASFFGFGCTNITKYQDNLRFNTVKDILHSIKTHDTLSLYKRFDTSFIFDISGKERFFSIIDGIDKDLNRCNPQFKSTIVVRDAWVSLTVFYLPLCENDTLIFKFPDYGFKGRNKVKNISFIKGNWKEKLKYLPPPIGFQDTAH